jgi:hypothetical protein
MAIRHRNNTIGLLGQLGRSNNALRRRWRTECLYTGAEILGPQLSEVMTKEEVSLNSKRNR